jgi:NADPH-dependent glutamate synthase beta subunit-like oxidoreductase/ferredoxin
MKSPFTITIDGRDVQVGHGETVLSAARRLGLEIPTLCYLEKCGPLNSCLVCLVKIGGKLVPACGTKVQLGMVVESETEEVHEARRTSLELLFSDHVGDCLSPCERLCPLRLNIPAMLRQVQSGKLDEAIGTIRQALPLPAVLGRLCHHPCEQGCRRGTWDDPAAIRDLEKFVSDWEVAHTNPPIHQSTTPPLHHSTAPLSHRSFAHLPPCKPLSGKSIAIIGAGPAGLTAAYDLARYGHAVTVVDRRQRAGGSLRAVPEKDLPSSALDAEIALLERMGIVFKLGVELGQGGTEISNPLLSAASEPSNAQKASESAASVGGSPSPGGEGRGEGERLIPSDLLPSRHQVTLEGLSRGFDAILLAVGALATGEGAQLGVPLAGAAVKADPNTCQTPVPHVFAVGAAVKPVKQLVRAMSEGRAGAECVHRFLSGQPVRRPEKPFSSIMGRLEPGELRDFLRTAGMDGSVTPCDRCAGFNRQEAATEASRCMHCDCRSSGQCALQHWAQFYGADASRFRAKRRPFEQHLQAAGGIIFEPGKCILCGICVKLTEMAGEPVGLTFTGRGFDARVNAALDHAISEGMQSVAEECVRHCPTGALAFREALSPCVPEPAA